MELTGALEGFVDAIADAVAKRLAARVPAGTEPRLLSVKDAAPYIGRTPAALRAMIASGEIPEPVIKRVGNRVFLVKKTLDDWISAQ